MALNFGESVGLAGASAGMGLINSSIGNLENYYFGGKQEKRSNERSEDMTRRQRQEQFQFDLALRNYDYSLQKQAYDYSNSEAFRLAEEYARNSASWQVAGLKSAGFNPILAATDGNFRGTFGNTGSFSPSSSGSSTSQFNSAGGHFNGNQMPRVDLAETLRDVNSAKLASAQADIVNETKPNVITNSYSNALKTAYDAQSAKANVGKVEAERDLTLAEAEKTRAMARQLDSSTALNLVRNKNETATGGVSSPWSFAHKILKGRIDDASIYQAYPSLIFGSLRSQFEGLKSVNSAKKSAEDITDYLKDNLSRPWKAMYHKVKGDYDVWSSPPPEPKRELRVLGPWHPSLPRRDRRPAPAR